MIAWMKVLHIAAIAVWCAGLLALPSLFVRKSRMRTKVGFARLHRFTRFTFISVTSPAAFVAVGTGTALIFLREVFTAWMILKLFAVGLLVMMHVWASYTTIHLFEPGRKFRIWQQVLMITGTLIAIAAILFFVLGKPAIDFGPLLPVWLQPGAFHSSGEISMPTP
jgi:protoporphyrinogen IX oxidase